MKDLMLGSSRWKNECCCCNMQVNKTGVNTEQASTVKDSDSRNTGFQAKKTPSPSMVTIAGSNSMCQAGGKEHVPCTK